MATLYVYVTCSQIRSRRRRGDRHAASVPAMSSRKRVASFGAAGLLVIAGAVCAAAIGGGIGELLALVLIGLGLVAATSLVFLEVGLSEDRQRARERATAAGRRTQRPAHARPRLDRMRGRPRRLG